MTQSLSKRAKQQDVCFNSAIFQALIARNTIAAYTEAVSFAETCNYAIDNSQFYGLQCVSETSIYEVAFRAGVVTRKVETIMSRLMDVLLRTNAPQSLCGKNLYKIIWGTGGYVCEQSFQFLINHVDVFPVGCAPSAVNICTMLHSKQTLTLDDPHVQRLSKVAELTLQLPDAYVVFNRMEQLDGTRGITNALRNALIYQEVMYAKILLQMCPVVDLDVFCSGEWHSAEKWTAQSSRNATDIMEALVCTARTTLEAFRKARANLVLKEMQNMPLALCTLINAFGARP